MTGSPQQRQAPLGLYIHVPFCAALCRYCNFTRGVSDPALERRYVDALRREIHAASTGRPADTIYFGGGTPSLLAPGDVARLIEACRTAFDVSPDAEVTLEANPETVTAERLTAYRVAGVNRLSVGVQSFDEGELRRLGRLHDAARARAALAEARAAGFTNVSLDLMLGLPAQTMPDLDDSLTALISLEPEHASLYLFELHPNAPLADEMARAGWSLVPDDDAADMYLHALARLDAAGYVQYEISNVARPGWASRHNLKYWTDGEWMGFGCGAHSTVGRVRWHNTSSTLDYIGAVAAGESPVAGRRVLSPREQLEEALFMELRLADGVRLDRIRETYGVDVWQEWGGRLRLFVDGGWLEHAAGRIRLTRRGMLLANDVMSTFLERGSTVK